MSRILHIDTSTNVCSVAISENSKVIASKETHERRSHASVLATFIDSCLQNAGFSVSQLDAIDVCKGPGSYTGLRIGVSTAKGLCYGSSLPLISVDSLSMLTHKVVQTNKDLIENKDVWFCPMIDAKRSEVYTAFYDCNIERKVPINAVVLTYDSFKDILNKRMVYCFGNGAEKAKDILRHHNVRYIDNIYPSADSMVAEAEKLYKHRQFEDVAYFEPLYLKDFIPIKPKNKILKE